MRRARFRSHRLALLLALGACGGDDPAVEPDADVGADAAPTACVERSGHACVWLGRSGDEGFNGDGHHRLETSIYWSMDMTFTPDGTAWFIDWNNHLVRRVLADGTVETVVGWDDPIFPGDGTGDASETSAEGADGALVKLNHPTDMVIAPDGAIMLMAWHNHKLRRIDPATGRVKIVAGSGAGFTGDGGPMAAATFKQPRALAIDADGVMYVGDQQNFRVRRIAPDGTITTIAGGATAGSTGDGGPATSALINWEAGSNPEPSGGLAVADGKLYLADTLSHKVRVIDVGTIAAPGTGIIDTLVGTGDEGYTGDGGPAGEARLSFPRDLEVHDGQLYIADTDNSVVRAVDLASGEIRTVAGTGELGVDAEDGALATETRLARPFGIELDADGDLYVCDTINSRILKVTK